MQDSVAVARAAFVQACELDVAVRKAGNVSDASPGHGMQAALFRASAAAAAKPLFQRGQRVGARVEAAVAATWAAAGCNTNLGILLLCAPVARAVESLVLPCTQTALRQAIADVLAELNLDDSRAAFRAIAMARPGGLGQAGAQDVHDEPTINLRAAMALAADRDLIARQYATGYADVFDIGLSGLAGATFSTSGKPQAAAVQWLYLQWLATRPDSHIVRKRGEAVAQTVMQAAQGWLQVLQSSHAPGWSLDADPGYTAWDDSLKASGVNPGTTADLTVATLMVAALLHLDGAPAGRP